MWKLLVVAACLAACSDGHHKLDAGIDAAHDAGSDAADAGPCGADLFFTGDYTDFESSDTGTFCGIFMATFQVAGDAARTDQTNPNGRFQLCLAQAPTTRIDITPPTGPSECSNPISSYEVPGIVIADKAVIDAGGTYRTRAFTVAKETTYNYLNTKAQVLVHVQGTPATVSISAASDQPLVFDGTQWQLGNTGGDVFFPNVDPAAGNITISFAGNAVGTGSYPVAAGTFTYATLVAQ